MIQTITHIEGSKVAVNVYSELNEWMDATFLVDAKDAHRAAELLKKSLEDWFDNPEAECECYGDWLEAAMDEAGIKYEVTYAESDSDEEE